MLDSEPTAALAFSDQPELSILELLDHVAVELAHEYVLLMEGAAVELAHEYVLLMEGAAEAESKHETTEPGENL